MNLGLSQLTDEQLFELLQETLYEVVHRDPYLKDLVQQAIYSKAEALKDARGWYEALVNRVKSERKEALRLETTEVFKRWVREGNMEFLTAPEERQAIDEGMAIGRREVALSALSNPAIPLLSRLSVAFASSIPLKIEWEPKDDITSRTSVSVSPEAGNPIVVLKRSKFSNLTGQADCEFKITRPQDVVNAAPQSVLKELIREWLDQRPFCKTGEYFEIIPAARSIEKVAMGGDTINGGSFEPIIERLPCGHNSEDAYPACPRCSSALFCPTCDYCFTCTYTYTGRKNV